MWPSSLHESEHGDIGWSRMNLHFPLCCGNERHIHNLAFPPPLARDPASGDLPRRVDESERSRCPGCALAVFIFYRSSPVLFPFTVGKSPNERLKKSVSTRKRVLICFRVYGGFSKK
ncbi:hypothetical protein AVEN_162534-1 [Araneus ventricosus]|uniref:Uncharacterized protein n=1 Tax=Araneus ventricosus TaxID=182803 RepID=A0A4Y2I596_ARAVE|nr:hypothetical protein AVEN_162534-1 [Araneus ventricosus]